MEREERESISKRDKEKDNLLLGATLVLKPWDHKSDVIWCRCSGGVIVLSKTRVEW